MSQAASTPKAAPERPADATPADRATRSTADATPSAGATPPADDAARPPDATPVRKLAQRDGGIALAALSLFAAAETWAQTTGLALASALAVVDGVVVGIVLGTLAHEWGHFAGARWSGGIAPTRPFRSLFPIFALDMQRSPARAFRAMSVAGNVGHWGVVVAVLAFVPLESAGAAALLAGSFGFAVSASLTEVPIIRRAFSGASPVESFKGLSKETLTRDRRLGAAAGVVLFLLV